MSINLNIRVRYLPKMWFHALFRLSAVLQLQCRCRKDQNRHEGVFCLIYYLVCWAYVSETRSLHFCVNMHQNVFMMSETRTEVSMFISFCILKVLFSEGCVHVSFIAWLIEHLLPENNIEHWYFLCPPAVDHVFWFTAWYKEIPYVQNRLTLTSQQNETRFLKFDSLLNILRHDFLHHASP